MIPPDPAREMARVPIKSHSSRMAVFPQQSMKNLLVTGGAGFIGSHLVRLLVHKYPDYLIWNLDKLTYAGNLENLRDVEALPNYRFLKGDITDQQWVDDLFAAQAFEGIIHLAAESHVDRSITGPRAFMETNVIGTFHLLEAARRQWTDPAGHRFHHVSTDEVYGSLGETGYFTEETSYDPRSPYSASKAASDHLVSAYHHTYGLPVVISNCSNNYGPYQFPEKLIPLMIRNIMREEPLPVYGDGKYTRDWLWVEEHAEAIDLIFHQGGDGETYNIGGNNEWKNIDLVHLLCRVMDEALDRPPGRSAQLIRFVRDRPGHDRRYAIDAAKLKRELGWEARMTMEEGLRRTVRWYLDNGEWMDHVTSGAYRHYYDEQYKGR